MQAALESSIILASSSPRRQDILKDAGVSYEVVPSLIEELPPGSFPSEKLCERNATLKARDVWDNSNKTKAVLGADTLIVRDGVSLGKPKDLNEGKKMLESLSGRWHEVVTGVCIIFQTGKEICFHEKTKVKFKDLSESEIERYQKEVHVLDKAGGYALQGRGGQIIMEVDGERENVIGLPIKRVIQMLQKEGDYV